MRVAVLGASGFVGSAVCEAVRLGGHDLIAVSGLRLSPELKGGRVLLGPEDHRALCQAIAGADAVINAAGVAEAQSSDVDGLRSVNGRFPGGVASVMAERQPGARFVHVSSASVQGRAKRLDDTDRVDGFSAYARSKIEGERLVRQAGHANTVIYRPAGVHGISRRVTRTTARLAASRLATVAAPQRPTPQALIENVASAIVFLATSPRRPPLTVIHPWEGLTTSALLRVLGGREPRVLPYRASRGLVQALEVTGRRSGAIGANARRLEMMWFGQDQAESWLTKAGWKPPVGIEGWEDLRMRIAERIQHEEKGDAS